MPLSRSIRSLARRLKSKILKCKRRIPTRKDLVPAKTHVGPCMCSGKPPSSDVTKGCVVLFLTEGEYKPVSNDLWAWKLRRRKRMVCEQCKDCRYVNDSQHVCSVRLFSLKCAWTVQLTLSPYEGPWHYQTPPHGVDT